MPVTVTCPHCSKTATFSELPVNYCPHCGSLIPEDVALAAEKAFRPQRPIMLTLQMYLGYLVGFLLIYSLFVPETTQPIDPEVYKQLGIPDMPALPVLAPWIILLLNGTKGLLSIASSTLLQLNRYKSRALLMVMVFVFTVPETALIAPQLAQSEFGRTIFGMTATVAMVVLAAAYFYLYKVGGVVRYYTNLRHLETPIGEGAEEPQS